MSEEEKNVAPEEAAAEEAAAEDEGTNNEEDDTSSQHQTEGERVAEQSDDGGADEADMDEISVGSPESQQKGGDSPTEKKAPPPFEAVNPKTRASVHDKLRAYESRRRTSFQAKLESSSLYWRSFRDLLQSSVHETARAERLILGTAKAHRGYADAMQASYEDGFLDKRGQVVLDQKRQKRLSEQRVEAATGSPVKTAQPMALTAEERKANMLTSIMEAQLSLSKKFGENASEMEDEIATEVTKQRVELEEKVASIRVLGDAILLELEKTEAEVSEAWGKQSVNVCDTFCCSASCLARIFLTLYYLLYTSSSQRPIIQLPTKCWEVTAIDRFLPKTLIPPVQPRHPKPAWMFGLSKCSTAWQFPISRQFGKRRRRNFPHSLLP